MPSGLAGSFYSSQAIRQCDMRRDASHLQVGLLVDTSRSHLASNSRCFVRSRQVHGSFGDVYPYRLMVIGEVK